MNELLCLKWNNHSSTLLKKIKAIYSKDIFCDVTIACHGRYYPAHKLVLSVCSEYFEEIFQQTQCKHPFLILKDIKPNELEALLSYMYNGEVNVPQVSLQGLIKAAESLKIKGLAVTDDPEENVDKPKSKKRKLEHSNSISQELSNGEKKKTSPENLNSLNQDETDMFNIKREPLDSDNVMEERIDDVTLVTPDEYETSQSLENSCLNPHIQSPIHQPLKEEQISDAEAIAQCSTWDETWRDSNHDRSQEEIQSKLSLWSKDTTKVFTDISDFHGTKEYSNKLNQSDISLSPGRTKHYSCIHCPRSFDNGSKLKRHLLTHTGERPYHCSLCPYKATQQNHLKQHSLTHTGEKPFKCPECHYRSNQFANTQRHLRVHHKQNNSHRLI